MSTLLIEVSETSGRGLTLMTVYDRSYGFGLVLGMIQLLWAAPMCICRAASQSNVFEIEA